MSGRCPYCGSERYSVEDEGAVICCEGCGARFPNPDESEDEEE